MRRVIIESPYAGDVERHTAYARACLRDSLSRGEAPLASHLLYTQVLDDADPDERAQGIAAGLAWYVSADLCAIYADLGVSSGMGAGEDAARAAGVPVEVRCIGFGWEDKRMGDKMIELGRRAVACKAWRWMPGMRYTTPTGASGRYVMRDASLGVTTEGTLHDSQHVDLLPDLTDPATIGCLLALVREAHGDAQITTYPDLLDSLTYFSWSVASPDSDYTGWHGSEAEALVFALDAAP